MGVVSSTGARHPLPVEVVVSHVTIYKLRHEIVSPESPIMVKVLNEKRRGDHSQSVMHEALCL